MTEWTPPDRVGLSKSAVKHYEASADTKLHGDLYYLRATPARERAVAIVEVLKMYFDWSEDCVMSVNEVDAICRLLHTGEFKPELSSEVKRFLRAHDRARALLAELEGEG